jgi:hypothetical protein
VAELQKHRGQAENIISWLIYSRPGILSTSSWLSGDPDMLAADSPFSSSTVLMPASLSYPKLSSLPMPFISFRPPFMGQGTIESCTSAQFYQHERPPKDQ